MSIVEKSSGDTVTLHVTYAYYVATWYLEFCLSFRTIMHVPHSSFPKPPATEWTLFAVHCVYNNVDNNVLITILIIMY